MKNKQNILKLLIVLLNCVIAYGVFGRILESDTVVEVTIIDKNTKLFNYKVNENLVGQSLYKKSYLSDTFYIQEKGNVLIHTHFDKQGGLSFTSEYALSHRDSGYREIKRIEYFKNGVIQKESLFNDNDSLYSKNISYTPKLVPEDNFIDYDYSFINAIEKEKYYNSEGLISKQITHLSHLRNFESEYNVDGTLKTTCFYITTTSDLEENFVVSYKKDSVCLHYFRNGMVKEETNYSFGDKHGIMRQYYDNGSVKFERIYKNGVFQNPSLEWNANGDKKEIYYKVSSNGEPNLAIILNNK